MVRGRVVFVVLRSGDDDHGTDEPGSALPLARFLPGYSRDLTGLDDQGAVETGGGRINPLPPRTFSFLGASRPNRPRTRRRPRPRFGALEWLRFCGQVFKSIFAPEGTDFVPKGLQDSARGFNTGYG